MDTGEGEGDGEEEEGGEWRVTGETVSVLAWEGEYLWTSLWYFKIIKIIISNNNFKWGSSFYSLLWWY